MNNKIIVILLLLITAGAAYAAEDWNLAGTSTFTGVNTTDLNVSGTVSLTNDLPVTEGGTGASDEATARTNLGLIATGAGDIWVEKLGDIMTGVLTQNGANLAGVAYQNQSFQNLLKNGDFESWLSGSAVAPDGWTAVNLAVAREATAANTKTGTYSMLLTSTGGSNDRITNTVLSGTAYTNSIGKTFTYGVWVNSSVIVRVNILEDGLARSETNSNGLGTWEFVTVTRTVAGGGTGITVELFMPASVSTAYIDGATLVEGSVVPAFNPKPLYDDGATLTIDTTNKRVGIGTSAPSGRLHVNSTDNVIVAAAPTGGNGRMAFLPNGATLGSNGTWYVGGQSDENFYISAHNGGWTIPMFINKMTGNVGIGTTSPAAKLQVLTSTSDGNVGNWDAGEFVVGRAGSTGGGVYLAFQDSDNTGYIGALTPGTAWRNLVLQGWGGNLGIGAVAPTHKLEILPTSENAFKINNTQTNKDGFYIGQWASGWNLGAIGGGTVGQHLYINRNAIADSNVYIGRAGLELVVASDGNVGIGNATPANILSFAIASATDPIADSWTTYPSDAKHKDVKSDVAVDETKYLDKAKNWTAKTWTRKPEASVEEAISALGAKRRVTISSVSAFEDVPEYSVVDTGISEVTGYYYDVNGTVREMKQNRTEKVQTGRTIKKLKAGVEFNQTTGVFTQEEEFTESEIEQKRQEIIEKKSHLPKFTTERVGALLDDPEVPPEVLVYDAQGNVQGYDLLAFILYQQEEIRELALQVDKKADKGK